VIIGLSSEFEYNGGFFNVFKEDLEGVVEAEQPELVEDKILELTRTMGYEGKGNIIKLYNMNEAFLDDIRFNDRSYSSYYKILGISVITSLAISVLAIYLVIRKNKYHYGVLLSNGATRNKIRNSILLENIIIIIFADIIGIILILKYIEVISPMLFMVYNILIISLIYITTSLILNTKKTIEFINNNEQNQ
jgi:ABC-type antimicrobial peptide transport system permease subunit